MGRNDMNHMQHLESVALSDCAVLEGKEATYQGSWKRAGGGSAWFMARRNLDRLITMMAPKEFPDYIQTIANVRETIKVIDDTIHYGGNGTYNIKDLPGSIEASRGILQMLLDRYTSEDIFMKIRENPGGEDGTVLACMRDARRYFMLVEAEMIAEGVVEPETKTYEVEQLDEWDGEAIDKVVIELEDGNTYTITNITNFQQTLRHGTCSIKVVRESIPNAPAPAPSGGGYAAEQAARRIETLTDMDGKVLEVGALYQWIREDGTTWMVELEKVDTGGYCVIRGEPAVPPEGRTVFANTLSKTQRATREVRELKPQFEAVISEGKLYGRADAVADGGSQHASANPLAPWFISKKEFDDLIKRVPLADQFYTQRASDVFVLMPVVRSFNCPREISSAYHYCAGNWSLKRERVPREIWDNFTELQPEMNSKEFDESPEVFKYMYDHDSADGKHKLMPAFSDWAREPN
jgi:hypothetical protein